MNPLDTNINTLARTLWGEARGEGYYGQQAVARVVMNRVALYDKHEHFGIGTIASACRAPWQFSCWNENDPNLPLMLACDLTDPIFAQCWKIATLAANGQLPDNTGGATFYYAKGSPEPDWAQGHEPCAVIGKHIFFKDIP